MRQSSKICLRREARKCISTNRNSRSCVKENYGQWLKSLTIDEAQVDLYVADVVRRAEAILGQLLAVKSHNDDPKAVDYKAIHQALLNYPGGVPAAYFEAATRLPQKCVSTCRLTTRSFIPFDAVKICREKVRNSSKALKAMNILLSYLKTSLH
jgi:hypothetical protein